MTTRVPVKLIRSGTAPEGTVNDDALRNGGRTWLGDWTSFNGAFGGYDALTGISPLTRALHNWAPREATNGTDSHWGSMAIVGSSQASKQVDWPAAGTSAIAATIGVSGFAINDFADGQAWGGYFDAVRMQGADSFTTGIEVAVANFGDLGPVSDPSPHTLVSGGAKSGSLIWGQPGAGMSLIPADLARAGLSVLDMSHISLLAGFTGMQQLTLTYPAWANSTAYAVGQIVEDTTSNILFRCLVAHTSSGSGTFAQERAANPSRWYQNIGALRGIVFGAGALAERGAGTNAFEAISMPERHFVSWWRKTGAGASEVSAQFYCDFIPDGSPVVQLGFRQGAVYSNAVFAGNADGTTGAMIQGRGGTGGDVFSFRKNGSAIEIYVNNVLEKTL